MCTKLREKKYQDNQSWIDMLYDNQEKELDHKKIRERESEKESREEENNDLSNITLDNPAIWKSAPLKNLGNLVQSWRFDQKICQIAQEGLCYVHENPSILNIEDKKKWLIELEEDYLKKEGKEFSYHLPKINIRILNQIVLVYHYKINPDKFFQQFGFGIHQYQEIEENKLISPPPSYQSLDFENQEKYNYSAEEA